MDRYPLKSFVGATPGEIEELQHNLIRSHAVGVGEELPRDLVLAMWLVLLNSVCRGHRGLALEKLQQIVKGIEAGIHIRIDAARCNEFSSVGLHSVETVIDGRIGCTSA